MSEYTEWIEDQPELDQFGDYDRHWRTPENARFVIDRPVAVGDKVPLSQLSFHWVIRKQERILEAVAVLHGWGRVYVTWSDADQCYRCHDLTPGLCDDLDYNHALFRRLIGSHFDCADGTGRLLPPSEPEEGEVEDWDEFERRHRKVPNFTKRKDWIAEAR